MKNPLFDTINLGANDVQVLEDSYKALKAKFNIGVPDSTIHINKFELFNNQTEASVNGTFLINYPAINCYLNFVKIHYNYSVGRSRVNNYKCQAWAFVTLKKDFGRILIRRETFTDKVLEVVHHTELKFKEDKPFSDKFYVVTNDEAKAVAAMTPDFRTAMMDIKEMDFVIETINNTLVIRNNQPVNPQEIVYLAEFASRIAAIN
jgi:hypothetical protein